MKRAVVTGLFALALAGVALAQGNPPLLTPAPQFVPVPPAAPPAPVPSVVTPSPPLPGVDLRRPPAGTTYYPPSNSTIRGTVKSSDDRVATRCVKWRGGKCVRRAAAR